MNYIYLDDAATTRVDKSVKKAMDKFLSEKFGNPSSPHKKGKEVKKHLKGARKETANLINAYRDEIIFTSGGTESDNLAIKGTMRNNEGNHLITTKIEHPAVYETCKFLEENGYEVTFLEVDENGFVNIDEFQSAIKENTVLASIMYANNEIGTIEPIKEVGEIATENDIILHTDAVQAVGKIPIDVKKENIDLLSLSGHKFHGPKGIGALYVSSKVDLQPMIHGGGHENGLRSGTENVPGIVGLKKACKLAQKEMKNDIREMKKYRDKLIEEILNETEKSYLNGPREDRLPNNTNFTFEGVDGDALVLQLDSRGIAGSTGSACSTKEVKPSRVLLSLGLNEEQAFSSLRLTLSKFTKEKEIEKANEIVPNVVSSLRGMRSS